MSIIRVANREQYANIHQNTIDDLSISWEARGLLLYLLGRCDDWRVSPEQLAKYGKAGRDKVYRMLKELRDSGYARKIAIRNEVGKIERWEYVIYERPFTGIQEVVKSPYTESQEMDGDKPFPENTEMEEQPVDNSNDPDTSFQEVGPDTENTEEVKINDLAPLPENPEVDPLPENPDTGFPDTDFRTLTNTDKYSILNIPSINIFNINLLGKGSVDKPDEPIFHIPYNGQLWTVSFNDIQQLKTDFPHIDVEESLGCFAMKVKEEGQAGRRYSKPFPEAVDWWLDNRTKYELNQQEPGHPALAGGAQ